MKQMNSALRLGAVAGALAMLAACGGEAPETNVTPPEVNDTLIPIDDNITEVPPSETPTEGPGANVAAPSPATSGFDQGDADVMDDAAATGMTSRSDRTPAPANQGTPAP